MSGVRVSLANENVAYAGVVSFGGEEKIALRELVAAVRSAIDAKAGA
ncbi:MAG TPA: hypothetical protein VIZ61_07755 [Solirubrobacterales bacterium]